MQSGNVDDSTRIVTAGSMKHRQGNRETRGHRAIEGKEQRVSKGELIRETKER